MNIQNSTSLVQVAEATTFRPRMEAVLKWNIQDISTVFSNRTRFRQVESTVLPIEIHEFEAKLSWVMVAKMNPSLDNGTFSFGLNLVHTETLRENANLEFRYYFTIGGQNGPSAKKSGTYEAKYQNKHWFEGSRYYLPIEELLGEESLRQMGAKRVLQVQAFLNITLHDVSRTGPPGGRNYPTLPKPRLMRDQWIAGQYNNSTLSDVTIRCDTELFHCHRLILCQSSVFKGMLTTDMIESRTNEITISDVNPTVLGLFLKYLYGISVEVPSDYGNLLDLLNTANKYDILALKNRCLEAMVPLLSDENAGQLTIDVFLLTEDPEFRSYFKLYCEERHSRLIKKPSFRELYRANMDVFM